jgi:hypothetical protein
MQQDGGADTDGNAVDRGDEGFLQAGEGIQETEHRSVLAVRRLVEEIGQVVAGREVAAGPRNQDGTHRRVGFGTGQRCGQGLIHVGGEGVLFLRAGDFDMEHACVEFDADVLAHFFTFDM